MRFCLPLISFLLGATAFATVTKEQVLTEELLKNGKDADHWILADLIMLTQPTLVVNREPYFMDVFKKNTSFPIMRDGN